MKNSGTGDPKVKALAQDIEDLVSIGKMKKTCPYYETRDRMDDAGRHGQKGIIFQKIWCQNVRALTDLILLPYNYVLDPTVRDANKLKFQNSILIFDEAHNIPSFCEQVFWLIDSFICNTRL